MCYSEYGTLDHALEISIELRGNEGRFMFNEHSTDQMCKLDEGNELFGERQTAVDEWLEHSIKDLAKKTQRAVSFKFGGSKFSGIDGHPKFCDEAKEFDSARNILRVLWIQESVNTLV